MLGLVAYGSDDSDTETTKPQKKIAKHKTALSSTSSLSLPPPSSKPKPKRAIFTVAKPLKTLDSGSDNDEVERPPKKPKLESRKGAGSSSLVAMLPAPSKTTPSSSTSAASLPVGNNKNAQNSTFRLLEEINNDDLEGNSVNAPPIERSAPLLPPSLVKKPPARDKIKPVASTPQSDFFSLKSTSISNEISKSSVSSESAKPDSISSAPTIAEFQPPSPSPLDPYPGYYQLPSGQWAAYDSEYYKSHWQAWAAATGVDSTIERGFEGINKQDTFEIDAQEQLDLTEKELEERKTLTKNAGEGPKEPRMNIKASNISSLARTRHQLSSLLTDAYTNRQALEEKIAQGRRNRKEAGNKYGF